MIDIYINFLLVIFDTHILQIWQFSNIISDWVIILKFHRVGWLARFILLHQCLEGFSFQGLVLISVLFHYILNIFYYFFYISLFHSSGTYFGL